MSIVPPPSLRLIHWHLYCINPIDFWVGWQSLRYVPERTWSPADQSAGHGDGLPDRSWFEQFIPLVARQFKQIGWEGDGHWHLTAIPEDDSGLFGLAIAVKQSNNGSTFVAASRPLPWLRKHCFDYRIAALPEPES